MRCDTITPITSQQRQVNITGLVQGVGFRPYVWHLAHKHQLKGEVLNHGQGVSIIIDGRDTDCAAFLSELSNQPPPLARLDSVTVETSTVNKTFDDFTIVNTEYSGVEVAIVADAATCPMCLSDIQDPGNRRYQYPFTNCTHCGPRYSIVKGLPYDREQTSMAAFSMCPECQAEYDHPADRRFHAQPNACATCGPEVWLSNAAGDFIPCDEPLNKAAAMIRAGLILAIKGIGGYQLVCDATNPEAIRLLRERKSRPAKPFAIMASSVSQIKQYCDVSNEEQEVLHSSAAPIVLLQQHDNHLPAEIAPGHQRLGFVLPYSPLHHILMAQLDKPIIFTSGNRSGLPQCTDNNQAEEKLSGYVDAFVHHNRDIVNRVDDSVVSLFQGKPYFLRRSRGYAPTSMTSSQCLASPNAILACGSQMKNTFSLYQRNHLICSQYIGDLDSATSVDDYQAQIGRQCELFEFTPEVIAVDMHPEYQATKYGIELAKAQQLPVIEVQHHHAHLAACLFDNNHQPEHGKVIGLVMDGLGYGPDNSIWGGELLVGDYLGYERLGAINSVLMPGATQAILQPWRMLLAHLFQAHKAEAFDWQLIQAMPIFEGKPLPQMTQMLTRKMNSPETSSCGRLFDAVAALLGICPDKITYEGQAAIELQQAAMAVKSLEDDGYKMSIHQTGNQMILESHSLWQDIMTDINAGVDKAVISYRFHCGLAKTLTEMASIACQQLRLSRVALCGGVFQNELLLKLCLSYLADADLIPYIHQSLPANDACISVGQAVIAAETLRRNNLCA
jgi:hydrogenase maturation protein HypF